MNLLTRRPHFPSPVVNYLHNSSVYDHYSDPPSHGLLSDECALSSPLAQGREIQNFSSSEEIKLFIHEVTHIEYNSHMTVLDDLFLF